MSKTLAELRYEVKEMESRLNNLTNAYLNNIIQEMKSNPQKAYTIEEMAGISDNELLPTQINTIFNAIHHRQQNTNRRYPSKSKYESARAFIGGIEKNKELKTTYYRECDENGHLITSGKIIAKHKDTITYRITDYPKW